MLKRRGVRLRSAIHVDQSRGIAYDTVMSPRIVIDTNVLVSALRSSRGASYRLLMLIGGTDFEIALSVPLVLEYEDVVKRIPEVTGLSDSDVDDIIDYLCGVAHLQEINFLWRPFLRDSRDDHVLELAAEAGCSVVVTHNVRDFAGSERFGVTAITPGEFLRSIGGA
jgi:putative PIN family toxin of toxin-antitoxin system